MTIRGLRLVSACALLCGLVLLGGAGELFAASKEAEAKKYTELLKTTKDAKIKATALEELGKLGQLDRELAAPAMPDMLKALKDKDATIRAAAAEAVGKCDPNPSEAVPALVELLKDKDQKVQLASMKGLASMGDKAKEALPALREITKENDKKTKLGKSAGESIKAITGKMKK